MKRIFAIILLIATNSALIFVMYLISVMSLLSLVMMPLAAFLFAGHVWAASVVQGKFEKRGWLGKPMFLICAGVPGLAMGILLFADSLSGTDEMGFRAITLYLPIYAAAFTAALGIVLLIKYLRSRRKNIM